MTLHLSSQDIRILLGATLMHWGVPFHFSTKRVLSHLEQQMLDTASERLIATQPASGYDDLYGVTALVCSHEERRLLVEVLSACLDECGDDVKEMHLHLKAESQDQILDLISRLSSTLH